MMAGRGDLKRHDACGPQEAMAAKRQEPAPVEIGRDGALPTRLSH